MKIEQLQQLLKIVEMGSMNEASRVLYIARSSLSTSICCGDLEKILQKAMRCGVYVIVDEAYGDFIAKEESSIRFFNLSRKSPASKSQRRKRWIGGLAPVRWGASPI